MAFRKRFVLQDESINTYGFWIKLSGMNLTNVQKNCPLYYDHRYWEIPCGHVENITLNDGKVTGDIVIEGGNDIEREYIRKIENGDLKGCSMGIDPVEWSTDKLFLKQGQTKGTLVKSDPFEVSLEPLPSNRNALVLKNNNNLIALAADGNYDFIPDLNTQTDMKKIAILLGMAETATEDQICDALKPLQLKASQTDALQTAFETTAGQDLPEPEKAFFVQLSKTNMQAAIGFLALQKKPATEVAPGAEESTTVVKKDVTLASLIKLGKDKIEKAEDGTDTFDYLQKHNSIELGRIKKDEPEKFTQLVADYSKGVRYKPKA